MDSYKLIILKFEEGKEKEIVSLGEMWTKLFSSKVTVLIELTVHSELSENGGPNPGKFKYLELAALKSSSPDSKEPALHTFRVTGDTAEILALGDIHDNLASILKEVGAFMPLSNNLNIRDVQVSEIVKAIIRRFEETVTHLKES